MEHEGRVGCVGCVGNFPIFSIYENMFFNIKFYMNISYTTYTKFVISENSLIKEIIFKARLKILDHTLNLHNPT